MPRHIKEILDDRFASTNGLITRVNIIIALQVATLVIVTAILAA